MGLLKRQGWPLLGVAEMRPRPKVWMPDGGSCGGLDESWQSDQIVAGHCEGEFETELFDTP